MSSDGHSSAAASKDSGTPSTSGDVSLEDKPSEMEGAWASTMCTTVIVTSSSSTPGTTTAAAEGSFRSRHFRSLQMRLRGQHFYAAFSDVASAAAPLPVSLPAEVQSRASQLPVASVDVISGGPRSVGVRTHKTHGTRLRRRRLPPASAAPLSVATTSLPVIAGRATGIPEAGRVAQVTIVSSAPASGVVPVRPLPQQFLHQASRGMSDKFCSLSTEDLQRNVPLIGSLIVLFLFGAFLRILYVFAVSIA